MSGANKVVVFGWATVLIAVAFAVAYHTTHDLEWPQDYDLYRDMASARSFLDEGFGRDPCYLGEKSWYNPLVPAVMAVTHKVTGLPLPVVFARCGAYLNLLAPIAFFLMAACLFNRWTALLALAGFLFAVGGDFPSWAAATYSPWIYPVNFAQAFFYLLIIKLTALRGRPLSYRWALLTGVLWGLTFLAHTAPALLFSGVLLFFLVAPALRAGGARWPALRPLLGPGIVMGVVAALVALPYLLSVVGHYRLHVVNSSPAGFVPDFLGYRSIPLMILRHLEPSVLVAWYGLYLMVKGRCGSVARRILLPWIGIAGAAVLYGYVVVGFLKVGVRLPLLVPPFHFLFYLKAALSLLFALGLRALGQSAIAWIARRHAIAAEPWARRVSLAFALALAAGNAPGYLGRLDYTQARAESLGRARDRDRMAVYDWAHAHAGSQDVVLASDDLGLFAVAPAGAKVVAVSPYLSSPYVDVQSRARDRDRMFAWLAAGDAERFLPLARAYRVTYVAVEAPHHAVAPALVGTILREVLVAGRIRLYQVAAP